MNHDLAAALAVARARRLIDDAVHEANRKATKRAALVAEPCPVCDAPPGQGCKTIGRIGGQYKYHPHAARPRPASAP